MSPPNWELYQCLKAQGRLNVLLRLSEPCASWLQQCTNIGPEDRSHIIPFVSRAMHLEWRERWKRGRFVRLSLSPEERAAILRQDDLFREADLEWERRHPKPVRPAIVLRFPPGSDCHFIVQALRTVPGTQQPTGRSRTPRDTPEWCEEFLQ